MRWIVLVIFVAGVWCALRASVTAPPAATDAELEALDREGEALRNSMAFGQEPMTRAAYQRRYDYAARVAAARYSRATTRDERVAVARGYLEYVGALDSTLNRVFSEWGPNSPLVESRRHVALAKAWVALEQDD